MRQPLGPRPDWSAEDREADAFKGKLTLGLPLRGTIFDYVYVPKDGKWQTWVDILPAHEIPAGAEFANILVPTMYTSQMEHMIKVRLSDLITAQTNETAIKHPPPRDPRNTHVTM